VGWAVWTGR
jgi:hypothetical protein